MTIYSVCPPCGPYPIRTFDFIDVWSSIGFFLSPDGGLVLFDSRFCNRAIQLSDPCPFFADFGPRGLV